MTTLQDVENAKDIRTAIVALAAGIDRIAAGRADDSWDSPRWDTSLPQEEAFRIEQAQAEGGAVVELPAPSPERFIERLTFGEQSLRLDEYYKNAEGTVTAPEGFDSWNHVYAKGGPYWLYTQDRELVMSLPYDTRQALILDLEQDDPKVAGEVARDILKQDAEASRAGAPS